MTVKELKEELKDLPEDMLVILSTREESFEPNIQVRKFNFDFSYSNWNGRKLIPKNQEFVELI